MTFYPDNNFICRNVNWTMNKIKASKLGDCQDILWWKYYPDFDSEEFRKLVVWGTNTYKFEKACQHQKRGRDGETEEKKVENRESRTFIERKTIERR